MSLVVHALRHKEEEEEDSHIGSEVRWWEIATFAVL